MNLLQAVAYFFREAAVGLIRSWRITLVAVLTIGISLFVAGSFLLLSSNLARQLEAWTAEMKILVYLEREVSEEEAERILEVAAAPAWAVEATRRGSREARERFQGMFPGLADLLEGWEEEPLPPSVEIALDVDRVESGPEYERWIAELRGLPAVTMVDDDRDWLGQLRTVLALVRWGGLALAALLLGGAILTIAGVIRLTLFLYRDEISVLRLVGATEFLIRGPFFVAGMLQGLLGGLLALGGILAAFTLLERSARAPVLVGSVLVDFLSPVQVLVLLGVGVFAGLAGTLLSLRRESTGA